jgi:hypothetical protein
VKTYAKGCPSVCVLLERIRNTRKSLDYYPIERHAVQFGRYRLTFKGTLLPPLSGYTMMLGAVGFSRNVGIYWPDLYNFTTPLKFP